MSAIQSALEQSRAFSLSSTAFFEKAKADRSGSLIDISPASFGGSMLSRDATRDQVKYAQYRGWVYSAIHALALEAASQPFELCRLEGSVNRTGEENQATVNRMLRKMPAQLRQKAAAQTFEVLFDHPLLDSLENPNPVQGIWQLVYLFVSSLNLTGRSYLIGGYVGDRLELFSLPSTWVIPDHSDGPYTKFYIVDPNNPSQKKTELGPENVQMAYLPNPSNPLGALAPITSQSSAVRIDDHIQSSQQVFFENGIFPSVVVTIGKDPHPEISGGIRPRLTQHQRRQITDSITAAMSGPMNYGQPAIVDGLVESITRLSATSNEMGWDKSEDKIRTRILSAFGVHPYILGEPVNVGGYAQAAKIEERFCKRINTFLDLLSKAVSRFIRIHSGEGEKMYVYWTPCEPKDPSLYWNNLRYAHKEKVIDDNELRSELGFPPNEDDVEEDINRVALLDTAGGMQSTASILANVGQGLVSPEAAAQVLALFFNIPLEQARQIVGDGVSAPPEPEQVEPATAPPEDDTEDESGPDGEMEDGEDGEEEEETVRQAIVALQRATLALERSSRSAAEILDSLP